MTQGGSSGEGVDLTTARRSADGPEARPKWPPRARLWIGARLAADGGTSHMFPGGRQGADDFRAGSTVAAAGSPRSATRARQVVGKALKGGSIALFEWVRMRAETVAGSDCLRPAACTRHNLPCVEKVWGKRPGDEPRLDGGPTLGGRQRRDPRAAHVLQLIRALQAGEGSGADDSQAGSWIAVVVGQREEGWMPRERGGPGRLKHAENPCVASADRRFGGGGARA